MNVKRIAYPIVVVAILGHAGAAPAAIVENFRFNDPNGTLLGDAVNSANPGNNWLVHSNTVESAVFNGAFRIQKQSATGLAGNSLNIANITSGRAWLVAEIPGWFYTEDPSSPSERVRFAFLNNDPAVAGSSVVTAEMNIDRDPANPAGGLVLIGDAIGFGRTAPPGSYPLSLTRDEPLIIALELNKDANTYTVHYKDGAAPWGSIGTGNLGDVNSTMSTGVIRSGNSVRFAFTGTFGEPGEFFDVGRIYVTRTNPIPEPAGLALVALAAAAMLGWRRRR